MIPLFVHGGYNKKNKAPPIPGKGPSVHHVHPFEFPATENDCLPPWSMPQAGAESLNLNGVSDLGGWRICSKMWRTKKELHTHKIIHDGLINWFYVVQRFDGKPSTWQKYTLMIQSLRQDINCTVGLNLNIFAQLGGVSSSDGAQKWAGPQVWFILTRSGKFRVNISKS